MKYCLSFIIIFCSVIYGNPGLANSPGEYNHTFVSYCQDQPFYFLNDVSPAIKLPGKIDLSFFKNQLVVFMYRFRLQVPDAIETAIDRSLMVWSSWLKDDFAEIIIPRLDLEGGHKLIIEYKEIDSEETKRFELPFYVYRFNPSTSSTDVRQTVPSIGKAAPERTTVRTGAVERPAAVIERTSTERGAENRNTAANRPSVATVKTVERSTTSEIDKLTVKSASIDVLPSVSAQQQVGPLTSREVNHTVNENNKEKSLPAAMENTAKTSDVTPFVESSAESDYYLLLIEAIEKNNPDLFRKSIINGAGSGLIGADGGNIFHLINDTIADAELISMLKNNGFPISEPDDYGNTPLHVAILSGNIDYAGMLINQGADLNVKNKLNLTPLHLAAILNDRETANSLMINGADINMKGNSGYTALHIASELNYISMAKDLLYMGSSNNIRTDQKLTPVEIARIQENYEMNKLIANKSSYSVNLSDSVSTGSSISRKYPEVYPKYDFILPFDNKFARKRHLNKIIQNLSIPLSVLGVTATMYLKSEADRYFSLSGIAETEEMARFYYDKTKKYDTFTYISGGISLISVYSFINSTIRKKTISKRMYKTFY